MFIHQIPRFVPALFPKLIWSMPVAEESNEVYFTFDDGPTPEITNFVLDCLAQYNAKATFFCIGKNIQENYNIVNAIIQANHRIGNHTMNHSNAWKMDFTSYKEDVEQCEEVFNQQQIKSIGFRPPYGRITRKMYLEMDNVILWSVLTGDYNSSLAPDNILKSILPYLKPGAIVVMHDSIKAFPRLKVILPAILAYCKEKNLVLSAL